MEEKNGRKKKLPVPWRGIEPTTLTSKGKAPVCIATFTLHKDPLLQLLYKYHEGYILNSIAQYPMHMKERERESVIEPNNENGSAYMLVLKYNYTQLLISQYQ